MLFWFQICRPAGSSVGNEAGKQQKGSSMKKIVSALVCYVLITTSGFADKVLILAPTVVGGMNSLEAQVALGLGYQVDLVSPAVWSQIPATGPNGFSSYRAIILGDPVGDISAISAAVANRGVWGPQIKGNIIIFGGDPANHPAGGSILTTNAIRFAVAQPNKPGLYIALSHYYDSGSVLSVQVLEPIGAFTIEAASECYEQAHIEATHPVMNDLTDAALSDWGCSVHETFASWPDSGPDKFLVLAIAEDVGTIVYTGTDLAVGIPYVLARGQGLEPVTNRLELTPRTASNPTNTPHTVCATVVTNGALAGGINVTFTVTSGGPNANTTGSAVTDASGVACFTYTGTGGIGTDTIVAECTDSQSQIITSSPVTKTWFNPCTASSLTAVAIVTCHSNTVLVTFDENVDITGTNKSNYTLDNGFNVTDVYFDGSQKQVLVTADQNFVSPTTYTLTIANVEDLCGRPTTPNPFVIHFQCTTLCPDIACPSNIVVDCDGPGGTKVHYVVYVDPVCTNVTLNCHPPPDSLFNVGTTTVYCSASAAGGGATNSCSFTVTVNDDIPPVINCPSNMVVNTACSSVAVPIAVGTTDNCCSSVGLVCTPPLSSLFDAGTITPVHCVATDCNGNTNSCDFTVQVIQVSDAGVPQITYCPTNILICATNGCGPMPDITAQVQTTDGGATVYVSQSIAPGTILCTNTSVTFTVSNLCGGVTNQTARVVVGPCCCNTLLSLRLPSPLTNITVWEVSGTPTAYNFPVNPMDSRLLAISGGPTADDFDFSSAGKYYDVFISDADGKPDTNGCCVTIVCNMPQANTDYASGNNIDAVELDFADGLRLGATSFGSVQLGQGLTDPNLLFTSGMATNALGLSDGNCSFLGYGTSSMTLCFLTPCPPSLSATAVSGTVILGWPNTASVWPAQWQLQVTPDLVHWTFYDATNVIPPVVITNIYNVALPAQFYRLFRTN